MARVHRRAGRNRLDRAEAAGGAVVWLRRRPVGAATRGRCAALPRDLGGRARRVSRGLFLEVLQSDPQSLAWVERRGFVEVERQEAVALDLVASDPQPVEAPDGVEIVTRAERPISAGRCTRWGSRRRATSPGSTDERAELRELGCVRDRAAEPRSGAVLHRARRRAWSGSPRSTCFRMTSSTGSPRSSRDWRGRGVGTALKRSQIAAAKERGFRRLLTESQHENEPMRRLNEKLGFRPEPTLRPSSTGRADTVTRRTSRFTRSTFTGRSRGGEDGPRASRDRIAPRISRAAGR